MIIPNFPRISDYVYHYANKLPQRDALVFGDLHIKYARFGEEVRQCARALLAAGVQKGDRVAMLSTPRPEFFIVLLATADIGAIWVGLNPQYQFEEMHYMISDARPKVLIALTEFEDRNYVPDVMMLYKEFDFIEKLITLGGTSEGALSMETFLNGSSQVDRVAHQAARKMVNSMDPAMIVFTAGTTGRPKAALLKHYGMVCRPRTIFLHRYSDNMKVICNLPINHAGSVATICCMSYIGGGTIYFMERFDPQAMLELTQENRITHWGALVTMFHSILNLSDFDNYDLSSLKWICWGGSPMPKSMIIKLKSLGAKLGTQFGMTETVGPIALTDPDADIDILTETVGRPVPDIEIRIVDENGTVCQPEKPGELQIRHQSITAGYLNRLEETNQSFTEDGFFKTGDLLKLRRDGNLCFVGRIKEMFKSGGYNIYPREIELAIEGHPAVAMAAQAGYEAMLNLAVDITATEYPSTLPIGSGRDLPEYRNSHFFDDLEDTILAETNGSIGLEDGTADDS